jgi:hypothetical protein
MARCDSAAVVAVVAQRARFALLATACAAARSISRAMSSPAPSSYLPPFFFPTIPGWQKSVDRAFNTFELLGSLDFIEFKRIWQEMSLSLVFNIGRAVCIEGHDPEDYRQLFVQCLYAAVLNSDADTGSDSSAAAKTFALVIIYKMPPPPLPCFAAIPPTRCRVPIPLPPHHAPYISRMLHMVRIPNPPPSPPPSSNFDTAVFDFQTPPLPQVRSHPQCLSDAAAAFRYLHSQNAFMLSAYPVPIHGQWYISAKQLSCSRVYA